MTEQNLNPNKLWTPANVVTVVRIILVPVFFAALLGPWPKWFPDWSNAELFKPWFAAALFFILACTDALDGYLARSRGEVTNFGKFIDPLADKILVSAALLALCELQILPAWVALIIITREFIVSGLRMVAASQGVVIAASWYGKAKTVFQMIAILLFIIKDSDLLLSLNQDVGTILYVVSWAFMIVALVLTVLSMLDYFVKSREVLGFKTSGENAAEEPFEPLSFDPLIFEPESSQKIAQLAFDVITSAIEKNISLSTAESCTGGLIAGALTAVSGSSAVVEGGVVSYSNRIKHKLLQVDAQDLKNYGAVSKQVACEMADGSRASLGTALAVSVTGIAGPGGGSAEKPVGTVWFGVSSEAGTFAEVCHFKGDRKSIRSQTVIHALELFKSSLNNSGK